MNDKDLDLLLNYASAPGETEPGMKALLARINHPVVQPRKKPAYWLSALPLAASLALGLYLGAAGIDLLDSGDRDLVSGIEDAESFAAESQS
jgi:hypothetical protein